MRSVRLHPFTLAFCGQWKALEEPFRKDSFRDSLYRVRVSIVILAVMYASFAILDHRIDPGSAGTFLFIRFALVMPLVVLFLLVSGAGWFERYHQPLTTLLMVLGAAGITAMIVTGNQLVRTGYQTGLLLVMVSLLVFMGIRFVWAAAGWLLILLGFILVNHFLTDTPAPVRLLNSFFFVSMSVVCIGACRRLERSHRYQYALQWSLSAEKALVAASNRSLENRIAERTAELVRSNQILRDEMARIEELSLEKGHLEARLRHSEKMETVGRLAGGVAHDFNNLLTAIIGNASVAAGLPPGSPEISPALEDILRAGEKAARLTRQLLAFSRKQIIEPKPVDLNGTLAELDRMIGKVAGPDIRLIWKLDPEAKCVLVDPGQLEQVVINLVVNARDAISTEGSITIGTRASCPPPADRVEEDDGDQVREFSEVFVADDGCGMDQATLERVFEPFFTTKGPNEGTGLGLSTVFGIVRQHRGHLLVESRPGEGAVFRVLLPRAECVMEGAEASPALPGSGGSETVLLVEDDDMVRSISEKTLAGLGYSVLSAAGGPQALELSDGFSGEIHLLLVDVVMPVIGGRTLAETLKKRRPAVKVLFTSGYSEEIIARQGVLEKGLHFIPKPYGTMELAAKIRQVLEEG